MDAEATAVDGRGAVLGRTAGWTLDLKAIKMRIDVAIDFADAEIHG